MSEKSNITKHVYNHKHTFYFQHSETLLSESNWKRRIIKESLFINDTFGKGINYLKNKLKVFKLKSNIYKQF